MRRARLLVSGVGVGGNGEERELGTHQVGEALVERVVGSRPALDQRPHQLGKQAHAQRHHELVLAHHMFANEAQASVYLLARHPMPRRLAAHAVRQLDLEQSAEEQQHAVRQTQSHTASAAVVVATGVAAHMIVACAATARRRTGQVGERRRRRRRASARVVVAVAVVSFGAAVGRQQAHSLVVEAHDRVVQLLAIGERGRRRADRVDKRGERLANVAGDVERGRRVRRHGASASCRARALGACRARALGALMLLLQLLIVMTMMMMMMMMIMGLATEAAAAEAHADRDALLVAALGALAPVAPVDVAVVVAALGDGRLAYAVLGAAEEELARLARVRAVVVAGALDAAHRARRSGSGCGGARSDHGRCRVGRVVRRPFELLCF